VYESCDTTIYGQGKSQGIFKAFVVLSYLGCIVGMFGITGPVMVSGRFVGVVVPPRRPALIESRENGLRALLSLPFTTIFQRALPGACLHLELSTTMLYFKTILSGSLSLSRSPTANAHLEVGREKRWIRASIGSSLGFPPLGCGRHVLPQSRACDKRQPGFDLHANL
jgi:hypothetical protein